MDRDDKIKSGIDVLQKFKKKRSKESLNSSSSSKSSSQGSLDNWDDEVTPIASKPVELPKVQAPIQVRGGASVQGGGVDTSSIVTPVFGGTGAAVLDTARTPTAATRGGFQSAPVSQPISATTPAEQPPKSPTKKRAKSPVKKQDSASMDSTAAAPRSPSSPQPPPPPPSFPVAKETITTTSDSETSPKRKDAQTAQVGLQTGLRPYHAPKPSAVVVPMLPATTAKPVSPRKDSPTRPSSSPTKGNSPSKESPTSSVQEPSDAVKASAAAAQLNYQHQLAQAKEQITKLERALKEKDLAVNRMATSLEREKQAHADALSSANSERQLRETVDADTNALRTLRDSIQTDLEKERKLKKTLEMDLQTKRDSMEKANAMVQEFLAENHQLRLKISDLESQVATRDSTLSEQQMSKSVMMDKLRMAQEKLNTENDILRRKLDVANQEIEDLRKSQSNSVQEGSDRAKKLEEENLRWRKRVDETRQEYDKLVSQVHDIREGMVRETDSLKLVIDEKSKKIRELEFKLSEAAKNSSVAKTYLRQLEEMEMALKRAENNDRKYQAKIAELEQQLASMHGREKSIFQEERVKTAKAELALEEIKKTARELSDKITDYEKLIESLQREIKTLQRERNQQKTESITVEKKYTELVLEHKQLKEYYVSKYGDAMEGMTGAKSSSSQLEEGSWKKEAEHWKNKYIESCIKVTDLIRSKRSLMYELDTSQQRYQKTVTSLSDNMQRIKDVQIETLKRENDSLENRIKILMKIVNKLTNINWEQDAAMNQLRSKPSLSTDDAPRHPKYEIPTELLGDGSAGYQQSQRQYQSTSYSTRLESSRNYQRQQQQEQQELSGMMDKSREESATRSSTRLAWSVSGHPSDSVPSIAPPELERIAAEKRKEMYQSS